MSLGLTVGSSRGPDSSRVCGPSSPLGPLRTSKSLVGGVVEVEFVWTGLRVPSLPSPGRVGGRRRDCPSRVGREDVDPGEPSSIRSTVRDFPCP